MKSNDSRFSSAHYDNSSELSFAEATVQALQSVDKLASELRKRGGVKVKPRRQHQVPSIEPHYVKLRYPHEEC